MMNLHDLAPRVLPAGWVQTQVPAVMRKIFGDNAFSYISTTGLRALLTIDDHGESGQWLHLSISYEDKIPSWNNLLYAKEIFLGDRLAIQILPPRSSYVNIHPYTLHLQSRLDGAAIPDSIWKGEE